MEASPEAWTPDAVEQAEDIRTGRRSADEVVQESIERIEAWDGEINSVVHRLYELRDLPPAADGPFTGVPMVVKDYGCQMAGDPYWEGMTILRDRDWRAKETSVLAERFQRAGLVVVGRSATPEWASSNTCEAPAYGPTRNPWDPTRSVGGSSGGSAAAVALGVVPVAHGNDAGGSIRIPAAKCGVVGLKTTRGRITLHPHIEGHVVMRTTEGVLTRSVRDTAAVMNQVSGGLKVDPYPSPVPLRDLMDQLEVAPKRLRVGFRTTVPVERHASHPDCVAAVQQTARLLEQLGHDVFEIDVPILDDQPVAAASGVVFVVACARAADIWSRELGKELDLDGLEPRTQRLVKAGRTIGAARYLEAVQTLQRFPAQVLTHWDADIDVLLTPTMPEPAPRLGVLGENEGPSIGRFATPFNITGQPALSLPLHWTEDGFPVGVQLVGDVGAEDLLLRLGYQLEQANPWAGRRPQMARSASAAA